MPGSPYPSRHSRDTFPSGEGFFGRARAGLPYGRPASRETCALRHRGKRRRPPTEADGGYSCSSGHAPMRRTVPFPTCPSMPADKPRNARQAHQPARNEGGPPVPPGRQRTTDITPQAVPSRPREEANSLAQHEVSPTTQAARGPGAAMVLSRFGCHRSPFGSFPRVGKNAPHICRCAKEPTPRIKKSVLPAPQAKESRAVRRSKRPTILRAARKPSVPPCKKHADVV